eukprot:3831798-Alexandrium_andersonii.AAC.1
MLEALRPEAVQDGLPEREDLGPLDHEWSAGARRVQVGPRPARTRHLGAVFGPRAAQRPRAPTCAGA